MTDLKVTLTGTGTPIPAPGRAGAGTLIESGGEKIQIDAGRGTVIRLAEAGTHAGEITALFLTHHHSDHVCDVPDVLVSRWIMKNFAPLDVVAPDGPLTEFGANVLDLWQSDLRIRQEHTQRPQIEYPAWHPFQASWQPETVWHGRNMTVSSVLVRHEPVDPAVAYRVETREGLSVVVSGDTRVCDEVRRLARGADVLVHEVVKSDLLGDGRAYVGEYHAEAEALGAMAAQAEVGQLMLTHLEPSPTSPEIEAAFLADIRQGGYEGPVIVGKDLDSVVVEA